MIILNFTKGETFSRLMTTKYFLGQSQYVATLLAPSKRSLLLPSSLTKKRIYLDTHLTKRRALLTCLENCVPYSHRQSRTRAMNTFIIVDITPTCKR